MSVRRTVRGFLILLALSTSPITAQESLDGSQPLSLEEIDRQLNNPLAKTWALVLQNNTGVLDGDLVDGTATSNVLFFQPLLPIPVGKNLVFSGRPVFPMVTAPTIDPVTGEAENHTTGFGDLQLLTLIGPGKADGWTWGAGATFKFPTASDDRLGQGQYQAGPAAMIFHMGRPWVTGLLLQHWSSFSGDEDRPATRFTDLQYVVRYSLPRAWSIGAGPSISYDWEAESGDRWTVPVGLGVTKTVRIGSFPMKLRAEVHYSIVRPDSFGERWNLRLQITPVIKSPFLK